MDIISRDVFFDEFGEKLTEKESQVIAIT